MKPIKYFLIFALFALAFTGCKSKKLPKPTETVQENNADTVIVEKIIYKDREASNQIWIDKPCDSAGILRDFKQTIKAGQVTVEVKGSKGQLTADIKKDSSQTEDNSKTEIRWKTKVITRNVPYRVPEPYIPKWAWYTMGGAAALVLILTAILITPLKRFVPQLFP